ncbi:MAG: hypothetical protein ACK4SY_10780 [Pyrobaculum sp.]
MRPAETALVLALLALGMSLIVLSTGLAPLPVTQVVGLPLLAFGVAYAALGRNKPSLFWGGVLTLVGTALITSGDVVLFLGVLLIYISLFVLLKR